MSLRFVFVWICVVCETLRFLFCTAPKPSGIWCLSQPVISICYMLHGSYIIFLVGTMSTSKKTQWHCSIFLSFVSCFRQSRFKYRYRLYCSPVALFLSKGSRAALWLLHLLVGFDMAGVASPSARGFPLRYAAWYFQPRRFNFQSFKFEISKKTTSLFKLNIFF